MEQDELISDGEITTAIYACDDHIRNHRGSARFTLLSLVIILLSFVSLLVGISYISSQSAKYELNNKLDIFSRETNQSVIDANLKARAESLKAQTDRVTVTNYVILALSVLVFGVLMAIYRFHLTEIAKAEHYKVGFIRIKIAARNTSKGYQTDVRRALTDAAFDYSKPSFGLTTNKKFDSPLPGHPTTDIATFVINKLLDQIEIHAVTKQKNDDKEAN